MRSYGRREVRVRVWAALALAALLAQALLAVRPGTRLDDSAAARALPPGEAAAWLALGGLRAVALSATWVRMLDAYRCGAYEEVPALAAVITALDPQLEEAWIVSAWTLAVQIPDRLSGEGAWSWVRQGLLLLRQGQARNPDSWRLPYNEGWIVMLHVVPKRRRAERLRRDAELNPEGRTPLGYAEACFERAAGRRGHPVAVDWARLDVLLARGSNAAAAERRQLLAAMRAVLAHVRRDHPGVAPEALADWEALITRLERSAGAEERAR